VLNKCGSVYVAPIRGTHQDRSFGIGVGLSWKAAKISAGVIWIRRIELDGQEVGDFLPDPEFLKTRDTYGSPEIYVGVSVIGWPPFKK